MRIAWVSPLPPMGSGIADYSYELLPLVAASAEVIAVCPRPRPLRKPRVPPGVELISPEEFDLRADEFDAVFYHLGNNPWHRFVYERAIRRPGVVVFHDFVMHHLIAAMMVEYDGKDWAAYRSLLHREYGEAGSRLALLRARGVATEFEKFMFPLNEHVARQAQAIVVHSEDTRERMHVVAPEVPVAVVPHHAGGLPPQVERVDRSEARRRLGLPAGAFVVGHFGYVTRPKQPAAVIGGFARLVEGHPDSLLVLTGADHTGGGLDRLIRRHGLAGRVVSTGYVDLRRFYLYLFAVDAVVNLRYPSAGESSGTFARALAEGRPAIVNNLGSFSEVPPDVALKVEVDGDQAAQVGAHLLRLAGDPGLRVGIERRARAYAASVLDPERCRDLYLSVARLEALKRAGAAASLP